MNLLLFAQNELRRNRLYLADQRAVHIVQVLRSRVDDSIRVGMIDGRIGSGRIVRIDSSGVELEINLDRRPPPKSGVELIVALPRPIMVQRILKQATVLGVSGFHFIRSRRVEKSFFQSPVLQPDRIRTLLLEALSQAVDTVVPGVHIHDRFRPFVEDVLPGLEGMGLLAHPDADRCLAQVWTERSTCHGTLLAIGPEGGWNDFEVDSFVRAGFATFSMGSRILHVDTAVTTFLGQLHLLADLRNR